MPQKRSAESDLAPPPSKRARSSPPEIIVESDLGPPSKRTRQSFRQHHKASSVNTPNAKVKQKDNADAPQPAHHRELKDEEFTIHDDDSNYVESRATVFKALAGPLATVIAGEGEDARSFSAHEGLLCLYSDYFKRALRGNFKEKDTKCVELAEFPPALYEQYHHWLYAHALSADPTRNPAWSSSPQLSSLDLRGYLDLYRLADYLLCPALQDNITHELEEHATYMWGDTAPDAETVQYVYENSSKTEPFRRTVAGLMVEMECEEGGGLDEIETPDDYPPTFWYDVARHQQDLDCDPEHDKENAPPPPPPPQRTKQTARVTRNRDRAAGTSRQPVGQLSGAGGDRRMRMPLVTSYGS